MLFFHLEVFKVHLVLLVPRVQEQYKEKEVNQGCQASRDLLEERENPVSMEALDTQVAPVSKVKCGSTAWHERRIQM